MDFGFQMLPTSQPMLSWEAPAPAPVPAQLAPAQRPQMRAVEDASGAQKTACKLAEASKAAGSATFKAQLACVGLEGEGNTSMQTYAKAQLLQTMSTTRPTHDNVTRLAEQWARRDAAQTLGQDDLETAVSQCRQLHFELLALAEATVVAQSLKKR